MLRLRKLSIRVATEQAPMGTDIQFQPGLVVLRADNSSGKSTSLQSVIFALGLEGMLSPSYAIPLPHAMTHRIFDPAIGQEVAVLQSEVLLEIENGSGEVATVRRFAKHDDVSPNLVSVFPSAGLTRGTWGEHADYFVRMPGAAQRERGFHHWLTEFLGWQLPEVPRFNGQPAQLYIETIFPLFMVEQKRGWSGVLSRVPTYMQIQDAARRAVEFVMRLSATDIALERQRLTAEMDRLRQDWTVERSAAVAAAEAIGGVIQHLPPSPVAAWPPTVAPALLVPREDNWVALEDERAVVQTTVDALRAAEVPEADAAAPDLEERLRELNKQLASSARTHDAMAREVLLADEELESLRARVRHLLEELRKIQDARRLQQLGSPLQNLIEMDSCPTCHQGLAEVLLDPDLAIEVLPLDESEARVRQQLDLVTALEHDLATSLESRRLKAGAIQGRISDLQRSIRAIRQTLNGPANAPSVDHIQRRLEGELRLEQFADAEATLARVVDALSPISEAWRDAQVALAAIRHVQLPDEDETKLQRLETLLVEQLREYGFKSLPAEEISLSRERYTPVHEGFDLGFDLSASDMIRLIWAYLVGLLELARGFETNHAGLLMFDEPRQQSADPVAFQALLHRAARAMEAGQQVVFATSEPDAAVRTMLDGTEHHLIAVDGFILTRLE